MLKTAKQNTRLIIIDSIFSKFTLLNSDKGSEMSITIAYMAQVTTSLRYTNKTRKTND